MKYNIYAIRDTKVGFMQPICDVSDQSAIRNFSYAVNNEGIMNYSPKDFDLYKIGQFESDDGRIEAELVPVLVVNGESLVTK